MKRKILSVFLCVFLLLPQIPAAAIPAAAATASVVYVKTFEELRKGLEANNNDVVILNGDIDIEIDLQATEMVERLISELADKQGVGEALKAQSQMQWVMAMNNIKLTAEEIVRHDLLCPVG